ncbi:MAG: response regulator, partial [Desulfobacteraceae bacterium]|nr:response regulator [Desulfobacteraceae bacterium]
MKSARILVIDDEQIICDGCQVVLSDQGHSVDFCINGKTGLESIRKGRFDLVLLDMKLPDMGGMEILRSVRKEMPGVYVIVMTGYSTVQNAVEAMKLGAVDYLDKPFSDDELVLAVKRALENKRLGEENILLRGQLLDRFGFGNIIGEDQKILKIFDQVTKVAPTDSTVLIYGESGTGKELFCRAIHAHSQRAARQFVAVDCST